MQTTLKLVYLTINKAHFATGSNAIPVGRQVAVHQVEEESDEWSPNRSFGRNISNSFSPRKPLDEWDMGNEDTYIKDINSCEDCAGWIWSDEHEAMAIGDKRIADEYDTFHLRMINPLGQSAEADTSNIPYSNSCHCRQMDSPALRASRFLQSINQHGLRRQSQNWKSFRFWLLQKLLSVVYRAHPGTHC